MSCFKLPLGLCSEIESLIRKFWWGQKGDRRKIHWVKWETLCLPKFEGGMGFKDLALFNDALLAKQAWRLLHNQNSLFYQVFKSKFFPDYSFMEASDSHSGSYAWQSILKGPEVLLKGAKWRVGSGESINVWLDAWLPSLDHPRIQSPIVEGFEDIKVHDLIDPVTHSWDDSLIHGLFNTQEFLASEGLNNWSPRHSDRNSELWKLIWGLDVPNKVKNFVWRSGKDAIPVKANLRRRKILNEGTCDHCGQEAESVLHAIWECSKLNPIWDAIPKFSFRQVHSFADIKELILYVSNVSNKVELMVVIMWNIWFRRNQLRVSNKDHPISQVIPTSHQALLDYQRSSNMQRTQRVNPPPNRVAWTLPPDGCVKINFDGATFNDIN
ncbi:uncharacterized protein LOC126719908 [Quercus robur]|uniref:uncharacterized protein LOC126719908 n=1 Tax=Quercus robur TaxID=38942 RepID=UPI0021636286|nr:uncharacterized protein LOC126719908 [Quercus robur]